MRPPPTPVSVDLVEGLHRLSVQVVQDASPIYSRGYASGDGAWDRWVYTLPSRFRSPLRSLRDEGRTVGWLAWLNGIDHLESLADLLDIKSGNAPRLWSYLTLSRVAVEAFLRAAYYAEPGIEPAKQNLRQAGGLLSGLLEQDKLAAQMGEMQDLSARELEKVVRRVKRAGISVVADKRKRPQRLELEGRRINVEFNASDQARERLREMPSAYHYGSAVVHSGKWFLGDALRTSADGVWDFAPDPDLMISAVVGACDAAVEAAAALAGADQSETVELMRSRFKAGLERALRVRRG